MNTNGLRTLKKLSWAMAASSLLAFNAFADVGGVPQASLNLDGSSMHYCNTVKNTWKVAKTVDQDSVVSGSSVTWTITATKNDGGPAPDPTFCVEGTLVISNTGAAPATVGNIVVNLQRQRLISGKQRWVSASVDVADKTMRDLATQAKVVAAASAEDAGWNAAWNSPPTYQVAGGVGTFKENAASGSIVFGDASWNDVLANSAFVIGPGGSVTLNYTANFSASALGINSPGGPTHLRTEVLVTFGNAGGRGGSGASIDNVDIDGSGGTSADELHVRTVPVRASLDVPALEQCNATVTIADVLNGTPNGVDAEVTGGTLPDTMTDTTSSTKSWTLITRLTGDGTITNAVTLNGPEETACCESASDSDSATVTVTPEPPCTTCTQCPCGESEVIPGRCNPCSGGAFCTYTLGQYKLNGQGLPSNGTGSQMYETYFLSDFPNGVTIGNYTPTTVETAPYGYKWEDNAVGKFTLRQFNTGGTGNSTALNHDLLNPSSGIGGTAAVQATTLTLNLGFSLAGHMPNGTAAANLGNVMVCPVKVGTSCLVAPISVATLLSYANTLLSGGTVSGYNLGMVGTLLDNINKGFDECTVSDWAKANTAY